MKRKSNSEFIKEITNLICSEYIFLEEYINDRTKILCRHNKCGHEWEISPNNFIRGTRCPKCGTISSSEKRRPFYNQVKHFIEVESNSGCMLIDDEYKNNITKMNFKCSCGNEFITTFTKFKDRNKRHCDECGIKNRANKRRKSNDEFTKEIYDLVDDEYMFLETYINTNTKIKCRHNKCGYEWGITPAKFLNNRRCPQCAESKGEYTIRLYLENETIEFEQEYSFDNLLGVGMQPLRFDFAIFNTYNNLKCLIEYDGEFHFDKYYEKQNFETQQIHDELKNKYCEKHNIPFLRIPYWKLENINNMLDKWFIDNN